MKIDFNLLVIFQFLVLAQGFTTGFLVLASARERRAHRWLGWLIVAMTLQVTDRFLSSAGLYRDYRWLYFSPLFYSWSYGPLLFWYFKTSVEPTITFDRRRHWWHFAPVAVQAIFYGWVALHDLDFKAWFWINVHKPYTRYVDYYVGIVLIMSGLWSAYRLLPTTQTLLRRGVWGLTAFYAVAALDPLLNHWYLEPRHPKFYLTEWVLPVLTYVLVLSVYLRRQWQRRPVAAPPRRADSDPALVQQIVELMERQRLFLNPELTLSDLAQKTNLSPNTVSHCLNTGLGQSFNDFVNAYRVAEVKRRLADPDAERFTLLGIAYESGFNSKTTFNRIFKEATGLSPKEYKSGLER